MLISLPPSDQVAAIMVLQGMKCLIFDLSLFILTHHHCVAWRCTFVSPHTACPLILTMCTGISCSEPIRF